MFVSVSRRNRCHAVLLPNFFSRLQYRTNVSSSSSTTMTTWYRFTRPLFRSKKVVVSHLDLNDVTKVKHLRWKKEMWCAVVTLVWRCCDDVVTRCCAGVAGCGVKDVQWERHFVRDFWKRNRREKKGFMREAHWRATEGGREREWERVRVRVRERETQKS